MSVHKLINTLTGRRKDIFDKIMAKVIIDHNTGCWEWQGGTSGNGRGGGYGRVCIDGATVATHIAMFINFFGIIPPKKQVDHKCNNRICCNPDHLQLLTHKQNQKLRDQRRRIEDGNE